MIRRTLGLSAVALIVGAAAIASPLRALAARMFVHPQGAYAASLTHFVGGFNLDNPQDAQSAAADGVYTSFHYDYVPSSSDVEQSYQSLGIHEFNGAISQYMWYYECHRVHTVVQVPAGYWGFCSTDADPTFTYSKLISSVTNYLQQVQNDSTIQGYWVLDDWPSYDATAASVLNDIHRLVQQYTPGKPTVCGFGAYIIPGGSEWASSLANNFTSTGCDMIGFYIYADTVSSSSPPSASNYDWTMNSLLPRMESDFRSRGWSPAQTPLIGIPQTFGGQSKGDGSYEVVPTDQSVTTQAKAFCQAGAASIVYYGWNLSDYNNPQSPLNNASMNSGVRDGAAACQQIWGTAAPASTPTSTPQPTQPAPTATASPAPTQSAPTATSTPVPTNPAPAATPTPRPTQPVPTATQPVARPTSTPPSTSPQPTTNPVAVQAARGSLSGAVYVDSYPSASEGDYIQFTSASSTPMACPRAGFSGVVTEQVTVPASAWYYVWNRLTTGGPDSNSYWLQIDNTCPILVGGASNMTPNNWLWVNYRSGNPYARTVVPLTAGPHVFRLEASEPNVDVDRLILTRDARCVPTGTGANCL